MSWFDQFEDLREQAKASVGVVHVVNARTHKRMDSDLEEYVYVDRPFNDQMESPLSSPFPVPPGAPPGSTMAAYRRWLNGKLSEPDSDQRLLIRRLVDVAVSGKDIALACWCAEDSSCHAFVLKEYLDKLIAKKLKKQ